MDKKNKYKIADPERCGSLLRNRRSWWADANGYPLLNKYRIDPRYSPRQYREAYQAQVTAWYDALDDKARTFLGPTYAAMADRAKRKVN